MPAFVINTNVARASIPASFVTEVSALAAKLAGKPESYVAIQINADQIMSFAGSTEPCAVCTFGNIGRINNKDFTKQMMPKISKDLHIPTGRMYIFFSNLEGGNVGMDCSTFG
jgi:phenylpyruvate tautomerase